jgi:hypothetical protein
MKKESGKLTVINRRELLKDALGMAAVGAGAALLGAGKAEARQATKVKPIEAANDNDRLQVEVALTKDDVSVELDGKPIDFDGGRVKATYLRVPQLKPTIHVLDVRGKVRQTVQSNQLIYARSPFIFACCCCCCCHTAHTNIG